MLVQKMASKQSPTPVKEGMPAALKDTSAVATQQEAEAKAAESDVDDRDAKDCCKREVCEGKDY